MTRDPVRIACILLLFYSLLSTALLSIFSATPKKSGREDSNLRPPAPKAGALARLRHAPIFLADFRFFRLRAKLRCAADVS